MFSNLIEAAVRLRFMVLCVLVGLGVFAALMIPKLNLDAFPDVTNIQVAINTEAPGLAAEEVEQIKREAERKAARAAAGARHRRARDQLARVPQRTAATCRRACTPAA